MDHVRRYTISKIKKILINFVHEKYTSRVVLVVGKCNFNG